MIGGSVDSHLVGMHSKRKLIYIPLDYEIHGLYPHILKGTLCKK